MTKRILPLILCLLLLCAACAQQPDTQLSLGAQTPAPEGSAAPEEAERVSVEEGAPVAQAGPHVTILQTVAYAFEGTLYGAAEYQNTGDCDIVLTSAQFDFTLNGGAQRESFEPVLREADVLQPGETGYCTLFLPVEGLAAGGSAALRAALACERAASAPFPLVASDPYLVQNYPGFATLSGTIGNPAQAERACAVNMIYAGFYDEAGALLGVWYFSRNAILSPGVSKPFVTHLRALPIPGLAEACREVRLRAFGVA